MSQLSKAFIDAVATPISSYPPAFCRAAETVKKRVGENTQHNPVVAQGRAAVEDNFVRAATEYPGEQARFDMVIA